ncbi:hypothetical protein [Alcaligenes sp. WGS1538]|uniref:hypothetical protein n=1 Tax=Alcaligenes sp. WGS1538 TaxID=3366811 RepID=UPI00372D13C3
MAWSEIRRALADKWTDLKTVLKSYFAGEPAEARAQREELAEARANSRRIGNLLGSLTARAFPQPIDPKKLSGIAQALKELNLPPESGLYSLKGARNCLDTYMAELNELDIDALCDGVLSNNSSCEAVLDRISLRPDDPLRIQASRVLGDIAEAVNQRVFRSTVHEPLLQIVDLLYARPVDGQKLCEQLKMITRDHIALERYFELLPADELKKMALRLLPGMPSQALTAVFSRRLDTMDPADTQWNAINRVERIRIALSAVIDKRVKPCIDAVDVVMLTLAFPGQGSQRSVCEGLRHLSVEVRDAFATYGALPDLVEWRVQICVNQSMDLFRDRQSNPVGPLNWHSLSKLDNRMQKNLLAAAEVLHSFGLELDPDPALRVS